MSHPSNESPVTYTAFTGVDERYSANSPSTALESVNTDFRDGVAMRRPGRAKLLDSNTFRPSRVMWIDNVGNVTDVTLAATDGDVSVNAINNAFGNVNNLIRIGSPFRFTAVNFYLTGAAAGNVTLIAKLFSRIGSIGNSFGGTLVSITINDGTASGGFTMKNLGQDKVGFSIATWGLTPWDIGNLSGDSTIGEDSDLYWIQFTTSGVTSGVNIADISLGFQGTDPYSTRSESTGLVEFATRNGDRLLVSQTEFPGFFNENTAFQPTESRILVHDLSRGTSTPLRIPVAHRFSARPGFKTSFRVFNGWLIGTTSGGYLWKYDGQTADALEALPGKDLLNNVVGAQGYLPQAPRGIFLEVYRNKLMVTGDPSNPLGFYASMADNDINLIPDQATIGGPNVWPIRGVLRVPGNDGDCITGASVINDRYVVLTRTQMYVYDEDSIRLTNGDIGCIAPASLQRINNSIYFLSDQGVILSDGVTAENISAPIWKTIQDRITWSSIRSAVSAHDKTRSEYILWVPINGEWQNQMAIIWNYKFGYWRFACGWYPWDTNARRDANGIMMSVTAACAARGADGRQIVVTCDQNGALWQENVGYDDSGIIFPAYMVLRPANLVRPLTLNPIEDFASYRAWFAMLDTDGSYIDMYALADGVRFAQEIDNRISGLATSSEFVQKQALLANAVSTETGQDTFATIAAWPANINFAKPKKIKFSFGRNVTKLQPVVHWAPSLLSPGGAGVAGPGTLYDLQIGVTPKGNAR